MCSGFKLLCHQLGLYWIVCISRPNQWSRNSNTEWTREEFCWLELKSLVVASECLVTQQFLQILNRCCCSVTMSYSWCRELSTPSFCPSQSLAVCSNSCSLSQRCDPTTSFSVTPFYFCLNYSQHQHLFQLVGSSHQVPKSWSFSFSISLSHEYSGLIFLRIDWFDLLAVPGTLKSLLQHHSSKTSILWCSASFMVQLSHPHITTGKIIALITWNFVGKVMSLFFDTLSKFVISFLSGSNCLLILWLQSLSIVNLVSKGKKKKSLPLVPLFHHLFAMKW